MTAIYPLLFPASFFLLLALERFLPGRPQPRVRFWMLKGVVFFMLGGVINTLVPQAVGAAIGGTALFDLSRLGLLGGALVGLLVSSLLDYGLHRTFHRFSFLWRWTHQLHHSAERVDMAGFAYTHPLELAISTALVPVTALVLGVSTEAAMLAGYLNFALGLFSHLNANTPVWLGYIVQRPEMHAVHHERGVHAYNYGLPVWDLLFGTFRNPATYEGQAGFWDGGSKKVTAMLLGRDVATPS